MEKTKSQYESMLRNHGLRNTAFRKDVLAIFCEYEGRALEQTELESSLGEFDRITLYRTLKSFEEKGLIHPAIDASGTVRFALCNHHCDEAEHHDTHAHFNCSKCGLTTCLDDSQNAFDQLIPPGYRIENVQISFGGVCDKCN